MGTESYTISGTIVNSADCLSSCTIKASTCGTISIGTIEEKKPDVDPEVKSTLDKQGNKLKATFYKDGFKTTSKELIPDIKDVIVYNDKVVTVEFADGTTEKAVLHPEDQFSIEQGISICITKKLVGGSSIYNKLIERALKVKKTNDDAKAKKAAEENARKERAKKYAAKKAARKAAKREQYIAMQAEAYLRAMTEFDAKKGE